MSGNITRAEAGERGRLVRVSGYQVELNLTTGTDTFRSSTRVVFNCERPGQSTWIDLIAPRVHRILFNGRELAVSEVFDGTRIMLPTPESSNELVVDADCAYMTTGEGLHRFVDPVDDEVYLYTQFETADARRVYACFEQPDLKGTFQLTVTAPSHWQVVSNASALTGPTPVADGTARWEFPATPVMSTYITALVAGPYHRVTDTYQGRFHDIPLGVFCRASLAEHLDADAILAITKQGFDYFEKAFDHPYPFGKYDQLFVPEFNAGAMENAGCVTFLEDYVFRSRVTRAAYEARANTILHEMAHMWFGDLVTMKWWDDLWLNESFAEWASHHTSVRATEFDDAWTTFAIQRKAWAYRQDQLPSTHPIAADMVDLEAVKVNFDGITYAKGASALKQLVAWVGEDNFLAGLRNYFEEFAWRNTELTDLLGHLERASGRDLAQWTREWLQTSGVNLLRPEVAVDADGRIVSAAVVQEPPSAPAGLPAILRSHRLRIGLYETTEEGLTRTGQVEVDVVGERTPVPDLIGRPRPDLLLLNDDDLTFAKIRLDPQSVTTAVAGIGRVADPLARTLLWGAAWDMTRDAEMSTGRFIDMVIAGLPGENEIAVVQTVLRQAAAAIDSYAHPDHRVGYRQRLAAALREMLEQAAAGSDRQLALVRAFAAEAREEGDLDLLAALLDGDRTLPGLVVDADLRWALLQRLVAADRRGPEQIAAEGERDATATGMRQRATAEAMIPTAEAKRTAWESVVDRDTLTNAVLDATMAGFPDPDREDLMKPYLKRYFESLDAVWQQRTPETAGSITSRLFPYSLVDEATVAAADDYLASDPHPSCARLVSEGRDTVQRSLRARAADLRG